MPEHDGFIDALEVERAVRDIRRNVDPGGIRDGIHFRIVAFADSELYLSAEFLEVHGIPADEI